MSLSIVLHSIQVNGEISERTDEIYALIAVTTLRPGVVLPALPNLQVFTYGVYKLKQNSTEPILVDGIPFWGMDGTPEKIKKPEDVGIVVSLMENDHGSLAQYSMIVKFGGLFSLITSLGDDDPSSRATRLTGDINSTLDAIDLPIPLFLDDDHVGTRQLKLTKSDLKPETFIARTLEIGPYELEFRIIKR